MFFKPKSCGVCSAKDHHISDLKAQIQDLRTLALPAATTPSIPLAALEVDAILNGTQEQIRISDSDILENQQLVAEASAYLSGTYE